MRAFLFLLAGKFQKNFSINLDVSISKKKDMVILFLIKLSSRIEITMLLSILSLKILIRKKDMNLFILNWFIVLNGNTITFFRKNKCQHKTFSIKKWLMEWLRILTKQCTRNIPVKILNWNSLSLNKKTKKTKKKQGSLSQHQEKKLFEHVHVALESVF